MENNFSRYNRTAQLQSLASSSRQRRSGYEPSDTETDWQESPRLDLKQKINGGATTGTEGLRIAASITPKNVSPMRMSRRHSSMNEYDYDNNISSPIRAPVVARRHSKSPYKPHRDDGNNPVSPTPGSDIRRSVSPFTKSDRYRDDGKPVLPTPGSDIRRSVSPFMISERRNRHVSPYKAGRDQDQNDRYYNNNFGPEEKHNPQFLEVGRPSEKPNYSRRTLSATRPRGRDQKDQNQQNNNNNNNNYNYGQTEKIRGERTPSPLPRNQIRPQIQVPTVGELNEMVANAKLSRNQVPEALNFESIESIAPGDIFFSRDCTALAMQKNGGHESRFVTKPNIIAERDSASNQRNRPNSSYDLSNQRNSSSTPTLSRTTTTSSSAISRQSSEKISTESSKMSDVSGRTSASSRRFTANRRKSQTDAWFACMRKGPCKTSKSPEHGVAFDEASFIEKAFVVEELRQFWADKYQPGSLNGFTCHKHQAQLLSQLVSHNVCPHTLFKGPSGSGKRALTKALLREIYGDTSWNVFHELRHFNIQEKGPARVIVPITSSAHHVELNVNSEPNAAYALMAFVKEISNNYAIPPEISTVNFNADYKVIVLYEVDKAADKIQHLIKWIMDSSSEACKLILCCEDDVNILEQIKSRCRVINIDAPVTHEIMEVLIQIARKEELDLSVSFAAKIAAKSKQNLRKAIMAVEACKAHNYPFVDDQPIPLGWEEVLVELAAEILADPSPKRLFYIRGKFQKLLVDFVHPKLILQKLVEQFLKGTEAGLKRELYYWHAYYDKRLPAGTSALLKLEEFVAKFMSIYRKSCSNHRFA